MRFELTPRDRHVVQSIGAHGMLATPHIQALWFNDVHRKSMDTSLKRLGPKGIGLIRKVGVRASKDRGGTPPAIYRLTPKGAFYIGKKGSVDSSIDQNKIEHTMQIADIYVGLVAHARDHKIIRLLPDSGLEHTLDGLRADLYLDIAVDTIKKRRRFFVEVQRNARKDVIPQKMDAHYRASLASDGRWPVVAFVAADDWIVSEIKRQIPKERRGLFIALTLEEFIQACVSESVREEVRVQ